MFRTLVPASFVLVVLLGGCQQAAATRDQFICLRTNVGTADSQTIVLSADGAARIDLAGPPLGKDDSPTVFTFLIPCNPREVKRLIEMARALTGTSVGTPIDRWERAEESDQSWVIECRGAGRPLRALFSGRQVYKNKVLRGVFEEGRTVASLELAEAIASFIEAGQAEKKGNVEAAFNGYWCAWRGLDRWGRTRATRIASPSYEPGAGLKFEYDTETQHVEISGLPETILTWPGMTQERAIPMLRKTWDHFKKGVFETEYTGKAIVVSFDPAEVDHGLAWGMSATVPPPLIAALEGWR